MTLVLGIDLGTTNSVLATLNNGCPEVIPNLEGDDLTPSVVSFSAGDGRWVGKLAARQATANPKRTIFSIKRKMGRSLPQGTPNATSQRQTPGVEAVVSSIKRQMGSDRTVTIDGRVYTPQEISAMILGKLKDDAARYFGTPVDRAVITVPAYFNDTQRRATKEAAAIAGLEVVRLLNEPTAAALAYGLDLEQTHTVLVWDLGGGTFDVSVLELAQGFFEVKAVGGNTQLGGDDYDTRLTELLLQRFQEQWNIDLAADAGDLRLIRELATQAKIKLSSLAEVTVHLPIHFLGTSADRPHVQVSREEFEQRCADLTTAMVAPTRQALADAGVDPVELDRILLVGGATRMPAVRRLAEQLTGLRPYDHIDPDKVVALGAAVQAGVLAGKLRSVTLVDVCPLSLGIETQGGICVRTVPRNTPIPTSKGQLFTNARDEQTTIDVNVLQGERALAADNLCLGRFELDGIEPQPRGEARLEVTFDIDVNGMVHVSATCLQTDRKKRIRIDSPSDLPPETLQQMIADARANADADTKKKHEVEVAIRAENLIAAAELLLAQAIELPDPQPLEHHLAAAEQGIQDVKQALADGRSDQLESAGKDLEQLLGRLDSQLKAARAAGQPGHGSSEPRTGASVPSAPPTPAASQAELATSESVF